MVQANEPSRTEWMVNLPHLVRDAAARWSLKLHPPITDGTIGAAWVAPATLPDGQEAVLKIGWPHMEAVHEIDGLRFWDGHPTVRLLQAHQPSNASLLEPCDSSAPLSGLGEPEQDIVIAGLLRALWRTPTTAHPFRPLSVMLHYWAEEARKKQRQWRRTALVERGLDLYGHLAIDTQDSVLLATDLHAGNVLRAERKPWLVIDPKPFLGDRAFDLTQHLFNCRDRLRSDPLGLIEKLSELCSVDAQRVRRWAFARAAVSPCDGWTDEWVELAERLEPAV